MHQNQQRHFLSVWTSCPLWPRLMRFYVIDLWLKLRFTLKVWSCKHSKTIWIHVVTRNNRHAVLLLQAFIIFMDQLVNFSETFIILTCVALIKVCCFERNVTQTAGQTYKKNPETETGKRQKIEKIEKWSWKKPPKSKKKEKEKKRRELRKTQPVSGLKDRGTNPGSTGTRPPAAEVKMGHAPSGGRQWLLIV